MGYFDGFFETVIYPYIGQTPKIGRTILENDCIVDTCNTFDCGLETAVAFKNNEWVVVQYYDSEEEAKKRHDFWCEFCKKNPEKLYSVQLEKWIEVDYGDDEDEE